MRSKHAEAKVHRDPKTVEKHQKKALPDSVKDLYQNKLREYLVVGGMPAVVNAFVETSNFQEAFNVQQKIFKAYEDDIQHYATNTERPKIRACYYSIPRQLAKEYSKFQYKTVEKNGSAKKYGNALDWLVDAGLIKLVHNYYKNGENTQEIEFVFESSGEVIPVEVKSKNGQTTSMNEFIKKYNPSLAIKLIDGNVGVDGNKVSLPQFMAMFLL